MFRFRAKSIKTRIETPQNVKQKEATMRFRAKSIKTRIETFSVSGPPGRRNAVLEQNPSKQGLKHLK